MSFPEHSPIAFPATLSVHVNSNVQCGKSALSKKTGTLFLMGMVVYIEVRALTTNRVRYWREDRVRRCVNRVSNVYQREKVVCFVLVTNK